MNWGYKILTVYILFVAGILFLVFKSSSQNQDLVTTDYYEQELKYQQKIDETERANALSADVSCELVNRKMTVTFPPEMNGKKLNAHILLYCTADKKKDIQMDLSTENARMEFNVPERNKGLHEVRIDWTVNETSYYTGKKIIIQ